jgi:hypothetical protein
MNLGRILNQKGLTAGKLKIEFSGILTPEDVLKENPELKNILNEIKEKGWRYLFIHTSGKTAIEFDISNQPSKIIPYGIWSGEGNYTINIDIGKNISEPKIKSVEEFRINISIKDLPRAVTIDIVKKLITYIDENFWNWKDEWTTDENKLSLATGVYEVVKWLIEEKKFELAENYNKERYTQLLETFKNLKVINKDLG